MTWGRGMAASGGHLQNFMYKLPEDVKTEFLQWIEVAGGAFRIVNGALARSRPAAPRRLQAHPGDLAGAQGGRRGPPAETIDAQWARRRRRRSPAPCSVDWPKPAIQLIAHFHPRRLTAGQGAVLRTKAGLNWRALKA
jgi:hypothetical protein